MNLAGAVILYNPTVDTIQNIHSYYPYISHLYILDNSTNLSWVKSHFENDPKITYIHDGENKGISIRLNQACTIAKQTDFDYILTMDQDSSFEEKEWEQYQSCLKRFPDKEKVAKFGINYNPAPITGDVCSFDENIELITSGSFINLAIYRPGDFDEALFIDEVDHAYCYQAIERNYKTIFFKNIHLTHSLGQMKTCRSLLTFKITDRSIHSGLRSYYMLRNYLYIRKKFGKNNYNISQRWVLLKNKLKNNFLYGDNKLEFILLMIKAYFDFKKGRMGKINYK